MYQFAYVAICEEPSSPLPHGSKKLSIAMELIEAAAEARYPSPFLQVLSDFRGLWLSILEDLSREDPSAESTGATMLDMANSVLREIELHRFQGNRDLADDVERLA
jgi:flagellar biosynthesis regulator FlaF